MYKKRLSRPVQTIKIMKHIPRLLLASLLVALASLSYAARESTHIELQVIYQEYVNFVGTAVGIVKTFSVDDIRPVGNQGPGPSVSLGTLGLESNVAGNCSLSFSTQNDFRLRHTVTNRRLTNYRLEFSGTRITRRRNPVINLPCNSAPSSLDFTATGRFANRVRAGVYNDIVQIVVTTQ